MSADVSPVASEFETTPAASSTEEDVFRDEVVSQGGSLTGTDAELTSSRWIEGWRGYEQQVVSVAATSGSLSGTFQLQYGDQATAPLDVNASAEAVEVSFAADSRKSEAHFPTLESGWLFVVYCTHAAILDAENIYRYRSHCLLVSSTHDSKPMQTPSI